MTRTRLQQIGLAVLILSVVGLLMYKESAEQTRRLNTPPPARPGAASVATARLLSDADFPPPPLVTRYQHGQLSWDAEGILASVWMDAAEPASLVVSALTPAADALLLPIPPPDTARWSQPSIHIATTAQGEPEWWLTWTASEDGSLGVQLMRSPDGMRWDTVPLSAIHADWQTRTPTLIGAGGSVALTYLYTDALGETGMAWIWNPGGDPTKQSDGMIAADPLWAGFQPPHAVMAPDGANFLLAVRVEHPPDAAIGAVQAESEAWVFRVPRQSTAAIAPQILLRRAADTFTERPMLAVADTGVWYAAVGYWTPPANKTGARIYALQVFGSNDGREWRTLASPLPVQIQIASAQPYLGAWGNRVALVYALDITEQIVENAHLLQIVQSIDGGATWSPPALLVPREPGDLSTDWPIDLQVRDGRAGLLFQRIHPGARREGSIAVGAPTAEMWVAEWEM